MAQYQTFPGNLGDSRTLDKLKALRLPSLAGKRFLDIGCNEGFFCGYARYDGAAHVVGIDSSAEYIGRARKRFPECEFLHQDWSELPSGPFDVTLLASALHYADDPPALLRALMERLDRTGVLVLELGIAAGDHSAWVEVERGIDRRRFPTFGMVEEMLKDHAWKWIGPSIDQGGDPVPRHVVHVNHRHPIAYLLMQPPGYGKSTLAADLFKRAGVPVVSSDQSLQSIANGQFDCPSRLRELVVKDFSAFALDRTVERLFAEGAGEEIVDIWIAQSGTGKDFALDGYVPETHHAQVQEALTRRGYLPVRLDWDRAGPAPLPDGAHVARAEAYHEALMLGTDFDSAKPTLHFDGVIGFVDDIQIIDGELRVRGWAVHESGAMPLLLAVDVGGVRLIVEQFERHQRPDVQRHVGLNHDLCGFSFRLAWPRGTKRRVPKLLVLGGESVDHLVSLPISDTAKHPLGK